MVEKTKRVVIGLSGGVDSAVSAYLLKQQGYEVIACFMENWDDVLNNDVLGHRNNQKFGCTSKQDFEDATKVANFLNIPIYKANFVNEYWNDVFQTFLEQYKQGLTPNPDVLCNRYIKFGVFAQYVKEQFHPDLIATGHYAGCSTDQNNVNHLLLCKDQNKDQTYFLSYLKNKQLSNVIFPLFNYTKKEVREIAKKANLPVWNKKDSTGICFIGERHFSDFLKNYLSTKPGKIIQIETNQVIGQHNGVYYYTIGQRSGLNLGGQKERSFVCKKDLQNNVLYVAKEENEKKYLFTNTVLIEQVNKIINLNWTNLHLKVRFRHRQQFIDCYIQKDQNNQIVIKCNNPVRAITPGQYAVLYTETECLGAGVIVESWNS